MREKALKWMIFFLVCFAVLFACVLLIFHAANKPAASPVSESPLPTVPVSSSPAPVQTEPVITATPSAAPTGSPTPVPTATPDFTSMEEAEKLKLYINSMSLSDKIGQLVMFGFTGTTSVNLDFRNLMKKYHIGNVVLYGDNTNSNHENGGLNDAKILTRKLNKYNESDIPLLISIDIEGGRVLRFRWKKTLYSAKSLGKKNDEKVAYDQFYYVGTNLKEAGINMNLAPVLDIAPEPSKTFLDTRIISNDPEIASKIGIAAVKGLNDSACLSTAKHFPGHGGTSQDSHSTTPVVKKTLQEMQAYDLIPFKNCIASGIDAVLVAHISYPELDPTDIASMSKTIITDILRNELGHDGIVMSDDFRMSGLKSRYSTKEAAVKFILAGGDIILCGPRHDLQEQIIEGLINAAENGTLSEARINESVTRILTKKMKVTGWRPFSESVTDATGNTASEPTT